MKPFARLVFILTAIAIFFLLSATNWNPDPRIRTASGIVLAVLLLWIFEIAPLGIVAVAIPIAASFTGLLTWKDALAAWGDPVVFLFLGTFLLARALDKHGAFDWLVAKRGTLSKSSSGMRLALSVMFFSGLISTVQNNTAVTAMLLPVVVTLARRTSMPALILLALAWGSTFGGMATPVGTAPNFIGYAAMKKLDPSFSFISWLRVGLPVWLGVTLIGWLVLFIEQRLQSRSRPDAGKSPNHDQWIEPFVVTDVGPNVSEPAGPHSAVARRVAITAFVVAAAVWLTTGVIIGVTAPASAVHQWVVTYLPESLVPIAVALALFMIRVGPKEDPVLDRHDFQALDWDTLFLIAGGLCLGKVLESSGAAHALARAVTSWDLPPRALMFLVAGVTVLLSELTSNTATASLMVPLAGSLGPALGLAPAQAVWLVALSASLGFILPVSTPPNAIIYGTRRVPLRTMARTGLLVDFLGVCWVVCCVDWFA